MGVKCKGKVLFDNTTQAIREYVDFLIEVNSRSSRGAYPPHKEMISALTDSLGKIVNARCNAENVFWADPDA